MASLAEIEKLAKGLSDAREALKGRMAQLEDEIAAAKKRYLPGIRKAVEIAAGRHQKLFDALAENHELFVRPKTVIFHGIRVGYQKAKGEITWDDEDQVIRLIKKHFPDAVDNLVKTKETPIKPALALLTVTDLKKIGVTVTETSDQVFIKPTDSEIDKMINALLKDEEIERAA
jgi:hypothetical protein